MADQDAPSSTSLTSHRRTPFFSVVLPVYKPDERYLSEAIGSVLSQGLSEAELQLVVVDDASPDIDVESMVRRIAGDRAEFHRQPENRGLAANWNTAVAHARGTWVHILHQDDFVLPGFYRKLQRGLASAPPDVAMGLTRYLYVDADSHWRYLSDILQRKSGICDHFLTRIAAGNIVQFPAFVVRRDAYAAVGPFTPELSYVLDWEMWVRLALKYKLWYEPEVLACYRSHDNSETNRLRKKGSVLSDLVRARSLVRGKLNPDLRASTETASRRAMANEIGAAAVVLAQQGDRAQSLKLSFKAFQLTHDVRFLLRAVKPPKPQSTP